MDIIKTIRAEVERRMHSCDATSKRPNQLLWAELASLIPFLDTLEEPVNEDLEEAAMNYIAPIENEDGLKVINFSGQDIKEAFIAGAEWQKEQDTRDMCMSDNRQFEKVYELGKKDMKKQMMEEMPKWYKVKRGSCFDKHTNFLLSAREGHFYCYAMEVPRDGYIMLVDELERLPKEDEK